MAANLQGTYTFAEKMLNSGFSVYQSFQKYYQPSLELWRVKNAIRGIYSATITLAKADTTPEKKVQAYAHEIYGVMELTAFIAKKTPLPTSQHQLLLSIFAGCSDVVREIVDRYELRFQSDANRTGLLEKDTHAVCRVAVERLGVLMYQYPETFNPNKNYFLLIASEGMTLVDLARLVFSSLRPSRTVLPQTLPLPKQESFNFNDLNFLRWVRKTHGTGYTCALRNKWLKEPILCKVIHGHYIEKSVLEANQKIKICGTTYSRRDFENRIDLVQQSIINNGASNLRDEYQALIENRTKLDQNTYQSWIEGLLLGKISDVHPMAYSNPAFEELRCCISDQVVLEPMTPIRYSTFTPPCYSQEALDDWVEHYSHLPPPRWPDSLEFAEYNLHTDPKIKEKILSRLEVIREDVLSAKLGRVAERTTLI